MGKTYSWDINPFQDYLFQAMMMGGDIADKKIEADIYVGFATILDFLLQNDSESRHLDYEIKKKDTYFKVVAKNSISALWLSGIFPKDTKKVLETNEFVLDDIKYRYSEKTKKLTYRLIKK